MRGVDTPSQNVTPAPSTVGVLSPPDIFSLPTVESKTTEGCTAEVRLRVSKQCKLTAFILRLHAVRPSNSTAIPSAIPLTDTTMVGISCSSVEYISSTASLADNGTMDEIDTVGSVRWMVNQCRAGGALNGYSSCRLQRFGIWLSLLRLHANRKLVFFIPIEFSTSSIGNRTGARRGHLGYSEHGPGLNSTGTRPSICLPREMRTKVLPCPTGPADPKIGVGALPSQCCQHAGHRHPLAANRVESVRWVYRVAATPAHGWQIRPPSSAATRIP